MKPLSLYSCALKIALSSVALMAPSFVAASGTDAVLSRSSNPMLHASNQRLVDGKGNEVFLRCVHIAPWLTKHGYLIRRNIIGLFKSRSEIENRLSRVVGGKEAQEFWRKWEEVFITDSDFALIKEQGFNCVRLNFHFSRVLQPSAEGGRLKASSKRLSAIDRAIQSGERYGIYIILALSGAPGGENDLPTVSDVPSSDTSPKLWIRPNSRKNQALTADLWGYLSKRYVNCQYLGGYDIINEPNIPLGVDYLQLTDTYKRIVKAIRRADPHHLIILEGNDYARSPGIPRLYDIRDDNLMFSFHAYNWFNPMWKKPAQKSFEPYLQTRRIYNMPVFLGEFGEDTGAWIGNMINLAERNNVGWALWTWKRVHLGLRRPAIQEIQTPPEWNILADYLVGTPFQRAPSREVAITGMRKMLEAIKTENTIHNSDLLSKIRRSFHKGTSNNRRPSVGGTGNKACII